MTCKGMTRCDVLGRGYLSLMLNDIRLCCSCKSDTVT